MKTEKISDVLQGMDVNTEDAIVTLVTILFSALTRMFPKPTFAP